MKWTLPKGVSYAAILVAVASVFTTPENAPWLTELLGTSATTKLAALATLVAALSHSLQGTGGKPVIPTESPVDSNVNPIP